MLLPAHASKASFLSCSLPLIRSGAAAWKANCPSTFSWPSGWLTFLGLRRSSFHPVVRSLSCSPSSFHWHDWMPATQTAHWHPAQRWRYQSFWRREEEWAGAPNWISCYQKKNLLHQWLIFFRMQLIHPPLPQCSFALAGDVQPRKEKAPGGFIAFSST